MISRAAGSVAAERRLLRLLGDGLALVGPQPRPLLLSPSRLLSSTSSGTDSASSKGQQRPTDSDSNGGEGAESKEVLEERKRRSVQSYLEQQLGGSDPDRTTLAQLLQRHGVVVRGGQAEALRLMDALTAWKRGELGADPSS